MKAPISVIIPVFNRPAQLVEAVESVLHQTTRPCEIIIVDDGSTDETPSTAKALEANHPRLIKLICTPNQGPGLARESGRLIAIGEYIQYLDSDDILYPCKFACQLAALNSAPRAAACYGPVRYRYADGILAADPIKLTGRAIDAMFPAFLGSRWWSTHAPLWRREATNRAGAWTNLRVHEDWEYDCRMAATGATLCSVRDDVAEVRESRDSTKRRFNPVHLADRSRAMVLIWTHAVRAGLGAGIPEADAFSAQAFLLVRDCASVGLASESAALWVVAQESAPPVMQRSLPRLFFGTMARTLGFPMAGRASRIYEHLFRKA